MALFLLGFESMDQLMRSNGHLLPPPDGARVQDVNNNHLKTPNKLLTCWYYLIENIIKYLTIFSLLKDQNKVQRAISV